MTHLSRWLDCENRLLSALRVHLKRNLPPYLSAKLKKKIDFVNRNIYFPGRVAGYTMTDRFLYCCSTDDEEAMKKLKRKLIDAGKNLISKSKKDHFKLDNFLLLTILAGVLIIFSI